VRGELIGDRDEISIDPMNRRSQHYRRNLFASMGNVQIAIKFTAPA
jgi:hypothetical protein